MKKLLVAFAFLFSFLGQSQIVDIVKWKTKLIQKSNTEFELVMDAQIDFGWHLYALNTPDGGSQPLVFTFKNAGKDYELIGKTKQGNYQKEYSDVFEVEEYFFTNTAQFKQLIKVTNPNLKEIKVALEGQTCIDGRCVQEDDVLIFTLPTIKIEEKLAEKVVDEVTKIVSNDEKMEKKVEQVVIIEDEGKIEVLDLEKDTSKVQKEIVSAEKEKTVEKVSEKSKEEINVWILFLSTLLAGILVTFTPCVFPMIPMTVSFFLKQSAKGDTKKGRFNALMYGFFIVLIYVLISIPFHIFQGISGDVFYEISTNPYVNVFFFIVFVIFAISFLGAFEITIPSSLANKVDNASNKGGLVGIFFMALTLIIVSFSCTGPALGLVIGGALSTDGGATLLTIAMLGFGLGLALPFMIFALFPSMMSGLPKSGGWLNTVKVVFGFIELALAFKFLSMADLVMDWHLIEREVFIVIWIAIFLGLALYLFGKITLPHDSPLSHISVGRMLLGLLSLSFALYLIPGLWGAPLNIISGFPPPMSYSESPNGVGFKNEIIIANVNEEEKLPEDAHYGPHKIIAFHDYEKGLAYAKKVGKPVLIDFTGKTCVNCRRMEELVWAKPEILPTLKNDIVLVSLYVDDRTELPEDKKYVTSNGKEINTFGQKWSDLGITKYKANIQPYYILMGHDEANLNEPVGYTPDIEEYKTWLEEGIANFKKQ
ncbi:MAG: thiol:disulfide interchange protein [Flavobacterium sp.]|uniref:protein-disulfide reductase DsbD family protein n=1 Tax=Flavobacterium sp. TaxID=239 RepID=UPI000C58979B|nr:cytochrome c biogenesis protein CcdA [Flavobacterium sp.]MBF04012.1 thiol:disulfide interchange protein [Flavobacterium sp.]